MTLEGTGFEDGAVVQISGVSIPTTFVSATRLRGAVPSQLLADGGVVQVRVFNPAPTVGPSNTLTFSIFNPIPGLTSVMPTTSEARLDPNALPLQLVVSGFGFKENSVIQFDGADIPTVFRSSIELAGSVPQKLLENAKVITVQVKNPAPTLGSSEALPFSVYNPVPTVTSLDAAPILFDPVPRFQDDKPGFQAQVIIRGTNFAKEGLIYVIGTPCDADVGGLTGTRVSSTMIVGSVKIACTGAYRLGVVNPQPGGGLSERLAFNVDRYVAPTPVTITGLAPAAIVRGSGDFTLTISGSNIASGVVVNFGTAVLFPTTATASTVVVTVPRHLVREPGIVPVSVTNPDTTGNSNRILFTVN
jgi:hypothetical protein